MASLSMMYSTAKLHNTLGKAHVAVMTKTGGDEIAFQSPDFVGSIYAVPPKAPVIGLAFR